MGRKVYVVGVGMTKFENPGRREGWDYPQMAEEAGSAALADAGIPYEETERQVPDARAALQHNLGLGGAAVVTMYRA